MTNLLATIISCLCLVESGGDSKAVNHKCVGILQLSPKYVADANRIIKKAKWTGLDRYSEKQSREMAMVVLGHYVQKDWTIKDVALLHRLGIRGMKTPLPEHLEYAQRVENLVNDMLKKEKK